MATPDKDMHETLDLLGTLMAKVSKKVHEQAEVLDQIAEAQAKLSRLKSRQKASDTRRKIIVGSVVISNALREPDKARALAALLRRVVTREVDQKELVGLLDELDAIAFLRRTLPDYMVPSRIVTIDEVELAPSAAQGAPKGQLRMSALAKTYRYLDDAELAAAKPKAGGAK